MRLRKILTVIAATLMLYLIASPTQAKVWKEDKSLRIYNGQLTTTERVNLVEYALQFNGNPYVWGGNNLYTGVDCSGLCQQVYKHFGMNIPRTASAQANALQNVSIVDMNIGDLVYYSDGYRIYHIAMYIGNGNILQAYSEAEGIKVTPVFYSNDVAGAVTVFGTNR